MQLPPITPSQQQILFLMYRFRFLSRLHIQTILSHKSPSPTKALLSDLTTKQYLTRIYIPTFPQNTQPARYFIGKHAIPYLKTMANVSQTQLRKLYHEKNRSESFQIHCLSVADMYCNLLSHARKQKKELIFFSKADLHQETVTDDMLFLRTLNPDGYYRYKGTGIAKQACIEIVDATIPAFVLRRKLRKYARNYQQRTWEILHTKRFPSLLWIVPTEKKLNSVTYAIRKIRRECADEDLNANFHCNIALRTDIQSKSIADSIWEIA
ncbi:MAG TPA: replication-relaxation family protein [Candidatus Saccharimonadales bacterium]|nr:replication-relaxation family protein [Candidatus Saccharimonadales bacterium]